MSQTIKVLFFTLLFVFAANGQNAFTNVNNNILSPTEADSVEAKAKGFKIFKILPRGMFDYEQNDLSIRGGGAYYSFVKESNSYNEILQLKLQNNNLYFTFLVDKSVVLLIYDYILFHSLF